MDTIGLICSVELEARPLLDRMETTTIDLDHRPTFRGHLGGVDVVVLIGGMGKTNAAQAVTILAERFAPAAIIGFGVAGAYRSSGLQVGDVAVATEEIYGDEGVDTPDGWMSCEGIGIPLLQREGVDYFNTFPTDSQLTRSILSSLGNPGAGPFVTVSACSGTDVRGDALARRHSAICESMEGAAYAHIATLYGIPFAEIRGISNLVEDRDLRGWRLQDAATAAATAIVTTLPGIPADLLGKQPAFRKAP